MWENPRALGTQRREGLRGPTASWSWGFIVKAIRGPGAQGRHLPVSDGELTSARPGGRGESNQPGNSRVASGVASGSSDEERGQQAGGDTLTGLEPGSVKHYLDVGKFCTQAKIYGFSSWGRASIIKRYP